MYFQNKSITQDFMLRWLFINTFNDKIEFHVTCFWIKWDVASVIAFVYRSLLVIVLFLYVQSCSCVLSYPIITRRDSIMHINVNVCHKTFIPYNFKPVS